MLCFRQSILNIFNGKMTMYCTKKMNGADYVKKYILILNPRKHIKIWQIGFITSIMETGYVQQEQKGNTFHLWCSKPNNILICINHRYISIHHNLGCQIEKIITFFKFSTSPSTPSGTRCGTIWVIWKSLLSVSICLFASLTV